MVNVKIIGGLGNQMFQYAAAKALATYHNTKVIANVSSFKSYDIHPLRLGNLNCDCEFKTSSSIVLKALEVPYLLTIVKKISFFLKLHVEKDLPFNSDFLKLKNNITLVGYFQTEKYFQSIRETLLKEFTIKLPLNVYSKQVEKNILTSNSISVHIRRGDYLSNKEANAIHGICRKEYFTKALTLLDNKVNLSPDTKLFVFSDDIQWCKDNLNFEYSTIFVTSDNERPEVDIHLMSKCQHNIISNSTFSWWGAWLNTNVDKIVIAPSNWFSSGSQHDHSDIIPSSWHKI